MNIMFSGDKGVCQGIFLSVLSICKHTNENLNFYILTSNLDGRDAIPQSFVDKLQSVIDVKTKNHKVILLDISEQFKSYLPLANIRTRFTPFCMLRLFADMVSEIPDKILYLDTDVICRADFKDFYNSDISDIEIVGVPDRYGKWFFGNVFKRDYLNSGVLLLNMAQIRKSGLFEKCRIMCRDKKMFMPDQSSLNKLAVKRKTSNKYNEQGKIKSDTVFKHFTTYFKIFPYIHAVTIKPWHIDKLHSELKIFEFDDIFEEYQRSSKNEDRDTHIFYN